MTDNIYTSFNDFTLQNNDLPDHKYDLLINELEIEAHNIDRKKSKETMIPEIKITEWYKKFLESFPECENKKLTFRQCGSFENILRYAGIRYDDTLPVNMFHGQYDGYVYILSKILHCGYLTKRKVEYK